MCSGGSSSSSTSVYQYELEQQQLAESAAASAASLAEQQREFDVSQSNRESDAASAAALAAQNQAISDQSAALTEQWQTGRSAEASSATDSINKAFAQFTPDYYQQYAQAYQQNYDPEVTRQYGVAKQNLEYGTARQGISQSQSAATQQGLLAQEAGRNYADVANKAQDASQTLQSNVESSKASLLSTALSDQTLGSPVTPGSADAISAAFDTSSKALSSLTSQAGDVVSTLSAPPSYSALGSLFGGAASGVASYVAGTNNSAYGYNAPAATASNPTSSGSSSRVVG